ncbi:MAG: CDP-alcohol phosphatidyltransferase family protein [Clostridiales bacterium]|nr:CDP-alcohol phosphatidyltransferase family protein [Clostridiales bacterium]
MRHIPNILSAFRIVLIPFFVWQMLAGNTLNAGLILIASGLTDTLDGNLARKFGWISDLGKVLDPVADKLTQTAVSICLMIRFPSLWFFFAALIIKDLIMLVLGGYLAKGGVRLKGSRWFGKVATVVFYTVMILIVLFPSIPDWCTTLMLVVAVICAVIAGLLYIPDYLRYKKERDEKSTEKTDSPSES